MSLCEVVHYAIFVLVPASGLWNVTGVKAVLSSITEVHKLNIPVNLRAAPPPDRGSRTSGHVSRRGSRHTLKREMHVVVQVSQRRIDRYFRICVGYGGSPSAPAAIGRLGYT